MKKSNPRRAVLRTVLLVGEGYAEAAEKAEYRDDQFGFHGVGV